MFDQPNADQTSVQSQLVHERRDADSDTRFVSRGRARSRPSDWQTRFVGALPELSAPDDLTLFVGEPLREQQSSSSVEPEREPAADLVRDQRIALLVRKHEGSNEDRARFEILTQRLRKLYPRVTQDDYKTMSEMVTDAESTAAVLAGVRAKFGLR